MKNWHLQCIEKLRKARPVSQPVPAGAAAAPNVAVLDTSSDFDVFPGFKSAIETCHLNWNDYLLPGTNYIQQYPNCAVLFSKLHDATESGKVAHAKGYGISQVSCSQKLSAQELQSSLDDEPNDRTITEAEQRRVDNCSSSSEGFCEVDKPSEKIAGGDVSRASSVPTARRVRKREEGFSDCESVSSLVGAHCSEDAAEATDQCLAEQGRVEDSMTVFMKELDVTAAAHSPALLQASFKYMSVFGCCLVCNRVSLSTIYVSRGNINTSR